MSFLKDLKEADEDTDLKKQEIPIKAADNSNKVNS